ncbi:MAG: type VI secretion system lipoprotein TssJ [Desulfatiglandales bacterium]
MKSPLAVLSLLFCSLFVMVSCAGAPPAPPQYDFGKDGIRFRFRADSQLNTYQGSPHTLLICVYQLSDPNAFNQLAGEKDGLYTLLECQRFDASVTNAKRLIVQPGQDTTSILDRAEGTKYVGLAAGYYRIEKEHVTRLFKVPVVEEKRGAFSSSKVLKPGVLEAELLMGPQRIQDGGTPKAAEE